MVSNHLFQTIDCSSSRWLTNIWAKKPLGKLQKSSRVWDGVSWLFFFSWFFLIFSVFISPKKGFGVKSRKTQVQRKRNMHRRVPQRVAFYSNPMQVPCGHVVRVCAQHLLPRNNNNNNYSSHHLWWFPVVGALWTCWEEREASPPQLTRKLPKQPEK